MRNATFTVCWLGEYRPITVKHGACVVLDTGPIIVGEHWHRCMASFELEGETVTMTRFAESEGSAGYMSSHGAWTCQLDRLNAETCDIGGAIIFIPDWVDACARVYQQAARAA